MSCCRDHSWLGAGRSCIHTSRVPETQRNPSQKAQGLSMFSLTRGSPRGPLSASHCAERGRKAGAAAGPGGVDRDPPTPASSSLCLLALCSVCYDPCCLGSGPSSEFGREQHPAESSPKAPLPGSQATLVLGQPLWSQTFPRTSCSSIGGPPFVITRGPLWSPAPVPGKPPRAGRGGSCLGSVTWVVDGQAHTRASWPGVHTPPHHLTLLMAPFQTLVMD